MSNEADTVSKVELLRQTQQAEGTRAMNQAEGVLTLLHEIRDAVTSNSLANWTPPAEAMSPAEIQETLAQLKGQLIGIQKALPRGKFWRGLLERLEDTETSVLEETRRSMFVLVLTIILIAVIAGAVLFVFTRLEMQSILNRALLVFLNQ